MSRSNCWAVSKRTVSSASRKSFAIGEGIRGECRFPQNRRWPHAKLAQQARHIGQKADALHAKREATPYRQPVRSKFELTQRNAPMRIGSLLDRRSVVEAISRLNRDKAATNAVCRCKPLWPTTVGETMHPCNQKRAESYE